MTISSDLAAWALGLRREDLPAEVVTAARRHLLDGLGTAIAGSRLGAATPAVSVAAGLGGPAEATLLGRSVRVSAPVAALATGTLVHVLDFDDTHAGGLVHATAVVLPALLAVGEQVGADPDEALVAAVIGFETVCRIAGSAPHAFHGRGLHATMACGVFSSALVAARLLRLDLDTTVNALGIAGSQAGGLLEFLATGSSTKQLHPGLASHAGILAVRLAAAGADGPASVLEGDRGLYATLADGHADPAEVTADLGVRWETTRITLKPYPACQLMHAALDAARAATAAPLAPDAVTAVTVEVHPDSAAIVCEADKVVPRTAYDAKFSLPWSLAALLVDGAVGIDTYAPASLARPEIAALAQRVRVVEVPAPEVVAADAPSSVSIELADGRRLAGSVERSAGAALDAKLAGNLGSAAAAAELAAAVETLDLSVLVPLADRLAALEENA